MSFVFGGDDAFMTPNEAKVERLMQTLKFAESMLVKAAQRLGLAQAEVLNPDEGDLTSPIFVRRSELERTITGLQEAIEIIEHRIAEKRMWLASYDEDRRKFRAALEATEEATETAEGEGPEDDTIAKLRALRGKDCTYGDVPFLECSYVKDRLSSTRTR